MNYQGTAKEDIEISSLLTLVFVQEGYTDKSSAERMFVPSEIRKRGEIILARSSAGKLLGMIICVPFPSPARQVAEVDEAEIHLLAVHPEARGNGIASNLIMVCEKRALKLGYSKLVLSTQQTMKEAHYIYEHLGYRQNPLRNWSKGTKIYHVFEKLLDNSRN